MDDPGSISYLVAIIILVAILIVEEVVYLVRSALNALTDSRAEELGEHPKKNVQKLIARKDDVFLAISLTSILMTTLFAMTATLAFAPPLMDWLHGLGVPAVWCTVLALIIIPFLSAGILMTLTGIIPRKVGQKRPYGVITRFSGIALAIYTLQRPAVAICSGVSSLLMKLFGLERMKAEDSVTEAEILSQVETAGDTGAIDDEQREMINNIFEFDDVFVSDLMTHRTDVTAVADTAPVAEVREVAIEEGYSRIPVYHKTIDDIVGIVYVRSPSPSTNTAGPPASSRSKTCSKPSSETFRMSTTKKKTRRSNRSPKTSSTLTAPPTSKRWRKSSASTSPKGSTIPSAGSSWPFSTASPKTGPSRRRTSRTSTSPRPRSKTGGSATCVRSGFEQIAQKNDVQTQKDVCIIRTRIARNPLKSFGGKI